MRKKKPEYGFYLTRIRIESKMLFLYGNTRVREDLYCGMIYAVFAVDNITFNITFHLYLLLHLSM